MLIITCVPRMKILNRSLCRKFFFTLLRTLFSVAKLCHVFSSVLRQTLLLMYFQNRVVAHGLNYFPQQSLFGRGSCTEGIIRA
jgi:hypothetical protein